MKKHLKICIATVLSLMAVVPMVSCGTNGETQKEEDLVLESIKGSGAKTDYFRGEVFDSTGLVVTATYSDGSTKVVEGWKVLTTEALTPDVDTVSIKYSENGKSVFDRYAVTVKEYKVSTIELLEYPKEVLIDGKLNLGSIKLKTVKANGEIEEKYGFDSAITVTYDSSKAGEQEATVKFVDPNYSDNILNTSFKFTVTAPAAITQVRVGRGTLDEGRLPNGIFRGCTKENFPKYFFFDEYIESKVFKRRLCTIDNSLVGQKVTIGELEWEIEEYVEIDDFVVPDTYTLDDFYDVHVKNYKDSLGKVWADIVISFDGVAETITKYWQPKA